MSHRTRDWLDTLRTPSLRYVVPGASLFVTIVAIVLVLWVRQTGPLLMLAAVGPPITALLLAHAAAGGGVSPGRLAGAFTLGGTLIPFLVLLTAGIFFGVLYALVEPLTRAGRDLADRLSLDPSLIEVLTSPWAIVLFVELAVVAPVSEETLKPLAARLLGPRSRREAFLLGAAAGAGFAAVENILYASGWFWSFDWWLPVAVLRSSGAALHLIGAGLVSVALYERRTGAAHRTSVVAAWGVAVGVHAFWNGSIAVAIALFSERATLAGLGGTALDWGVALQAVLGAAGMIVLGGLVLVGRWAAAEEPMPLRRLIDFERPALVVGWASLSALMIVPAIVMILVFPEFIAL